MKKEETYFQQSNGRLALFQPDFIRDADCTKDTPVMIEFWHHDIDGGHPVRRMDWRCTSSYIHAFLGAEKVPLRVSWRKNGFFGELYRIGASEPIEWQEPDTQEILQCSLSKKYKECLKLKEKSAEDMEKQLEQFGYRMKFPMKTGDLSKRWCSAYLKIMVADTVLRNLDSLEHLEKIGGRRLKFPAKGGPIRDAGAAGVSKLPCRTA